MKMKKKILSVAVMAALGAGTAQAVNLSQDGTGEVLLFPYFTVQGGEETILSIVNTHDEVKAVKIRFRESYNSREVLDFNLYLSPYDVWTAKITDDGNNGAKIITGDNSCTVPAIPAGGVSFRQFDYTGANNDDGPDGVERTRDGYFEYIEMGVADANGIWDRNANGQNDAVHGATGVPDNCAGLVANWAPGGGWLTNAATGMLAPTGGLFGAAAILNVGTGTEYNVRPTVLAAFSDVQLHAQPGDTNPTLGRVNPARSVALINDTANPQAVSVYVDNWNPANAIDAVSAILMTSRLMNEYTVNPAVEAATAWVVTFPTKWGYVDPRVVGTTVRAPFTNLFSDGDAILTGAGAGTTGKSCDTVVGSYWDREEQKIVGNVDFSPLPPGTAFELCYEANVVTFGSTTSDANTVTNFPLATGFTSGWSAFGFNAATMTLTGSATTFSGLPAIGFRATKLGNSNVGVGASYQTSVEHKYDRLVSGQPQGTY
jgi:hypothetical protein